MKVKIRLSWVELQFFAAENFIESACRNGILGPNHPRKYMSDQSTPSPQPTKRRGCFFYGCITVLVIVVLVGVAGFFAE